MENNQIIEGIVMVEGVKEFLEEKDYTEQLSNVGRTIGTQPGTELQIVVPQRVINAIDVVNGEWQAEAIKDEIIKVPTHEYVAPYVTTKFEKQKSFVDFNNNRIHDLSRGLLQKRKELFRNALDEGTEIEVEEFDATAVIKAISEIGEVFEQEDAYILSNMGVKMDLQQYAFTDRRIVNNQILDTHMMVDDKVPNDTFYLFLDKAVHCEILNDMEYLEERIQNKFFYSINEARGYKLINGKYAVKVVLKPSEGTK